MAKPCIDCYQIFKTIERIMVIQLGFVEAIVALYSMHQMPYIIEFSESLLFTQPPEALSSVFLCIFCQTSLYQMAPPQVKKSQGRKKIEMKLIADENARTVTFSKRRAGLFKKATELSILCGTQIAIIIFSLGGRAYSFGHPNVESVVGRFLNRNPIPNLQDSVHGMRAHSAMLAQLKEQCDQKTKELEAQKKKGKELEAALGSSGRISEERLNQLDMNQLQDLKEKLEKLREDVRRLTAAKQSGSSAGPSKPRNAAKPLIPEKINLANVENDGCVGSPIPGDWLKL